LNGKEYNKNRIEHKDFGAGGSLEIWLNSQPNKNWGTEK